MQGIYFTADTHFGHERIIKHCSRPFHSVQEMDAVLLHNINELVGENDILYHLGDFCGKIPKQNTAQRKFLEQYRKQIRCRKIVLIAGNHDPRYKNDQPKEWLSSLFSEVYTRLRVTVVIRGEPQDIILDHYSMRVWNKSHRGSWQLYGHSHGTLSDHQTLLSMEVGVDASKMHPVSLAQVSAHMQTRKLRITEREDNVTISP